VTNQLYLSQPGGGTLCPTLFLRPFYYIALYWGL
jgi:hypothetical protein